MLGLLHHRTELAEDVEVVVDRSAADPTPAEVGGEGFPQAVEQGPQKRIRLDPAWASMSAMWASSTLLESNSSTSSAGWPSDIWTPCSSSSPATIALETEFFAPRTAMVPCSGVPP